MTPEHRAWLLRLFKLHRAFLDYAHQEAAASRERPLSEYDKLVLNRFLDFAKEADL
jgi:hypothetical protein